MNSDIDEEKQEYIQIIENNNNLLLQLINDILDLSKIEAGVLEFSYNNINVDELFMDIEESTKMRNQNKNVCILYKRTLPSCYISTDKNRLTQVITNMINNAMKFTQRGSIEFGYNLQTVFLNVLLNSTILHKVQAWGYPFAKPSSQAWGAKSE